MPAVTGSKWLTTLGWSDVPHLSEAAKADLLASTPPHLREARSEGKPSLGAGAIYPIGLSEIECDPFPIPEHWPRAYALDVGWNRTAALWGAVDRVDGSAYIYAEYYRGQAEPSTHAAAIRARGQWIPGVVDPAARGRGQADGAQLYAMYRDLGLDVQPADTRDVEAGIYDVWMDLSIGRIKVFRTLANFRNEYRIYRRDEQGRIVKKDDHLMDCLRMWRRSAKPIAKVRPMQGRPGAPTPRVADNLAGY